MRRLRNEVHGFSLPPLLEPHTVPGPECSHFFESEAHGTVLDYFSLQEWLGEIRPEAAVHFAAQPLVGTSQKKRSETFQTNVVGTLNFLRAVENTASIKFALVITTDKVYFPAIGRRHVESDQLGGVEPYSQSKAVADFLTQEWAKSSTKAWGIARAGNIIGYGDQSPGRLLPDIARSFHTNEPLVIRNPSHVRPWQHVLECVSAYHQILEYLSQDNTPSSCEVFNVGPEASESFSVSDVIGKASEIIELDVRTASKTQDFLETPELQLSSRKIAELLDWEPKLSFAESITWTLSPLKNPKSVSEVIEDQVDRYLSL